MSSFRGVIAIVISMFRLAEAYATAKIPLSPFCKGGTQLDLSRMNAQIETTKPSGQSVLPFEKGRTGGILSIDQTEHTSEIAITLNLGNFLDRTTKEWVCRLWMANGLLQIQVDKIWNVQFRSIMLGV